MLLPMLKHLEFECNAQEGRASRAPLLFALGMSCTMCSQAIAQEEEYPYALIILPAHAPGELSDGSAINNRGVVVGEASLADLQLHATGWSQRGILDLGTFGGKWSRAWDVNNHNEIVGWATYEGGSPFSDKRAYHWKDGVMTDLGTLGGDDAEALAINDHGDIVGWATVVEGGKLQGCLWKDGIAHLLESLDGSTIAYDINSNGWIVGRSWEGDPGGYVAVLWRNDTIIRLPDLDGCCANTAQAINNKNQIVGSGGSISSALLWDSRGVHDLAPHNFDTSGAGDINNLGEVVGSAIYEYLVDDSEAWVWDEVNGHRILHDILPPNSQVWLDEVGTINDFGQITGQGYYLAPYSVFGYVLTPVQPEMQLSNPVPGIAGQLNTFTITDAEPGAEVKLVYSIRGGGKFIPGCNELDAVLQVNHPVFIDKQTADANGNVTFEFYVPEIARERPGFLFQAADTSNCQESQLVVFAFD